MAEAVLTLHGSLKDAPLIVRLAVTVGVVVGVINVVLFLAACFGVFV